MRNVQKETHPKKILKKKFITQYIYHIDKYKPFSMFIKQKKIPNVGSWKQYAHNTKNQTVYIWSID